MKRRAFLHAALALAAAPALGRDALPAVSVWSAPGCSCCHKWVDHMRAAGFAVTATLASDMEAVKRKLGVPAAMQSCHTALVGGYAIEGHVPADDIKRLLRAKPAVRGLAVPGMVAGSPGMEGGRAERFATLAFTAAGSRVYAQH